MITRHSFLKITTALIAGFVLAVPGVTFAQSANKLDIDAIVRMFHVNFSANTLEKNGELVDENILVDVNGGRASNPVNGATYKGRAQFVEWLKGYKTPFPDSKIEDLEVIVSGNKAAIRFVLEATHTGPLPLPNGTVPATNRKIRLNGTEFFTFNAEGKLVRLETFTDDLYLISVLTAK